MSSENDKNETSRFLGEGMSFKAKLIGILEVSEARGDRMCQEALSDLKIAIRAAGEHKQRIIINVAIDGLRLRDEKTGDSLYHHPVHKISFIAQDMTDSRAFGYIFGSPDTGHRFFGIKTDKAASQVVIAMRDLFQVVFALKKKEIELAKQNLEKNYCFNRDNSNVITESLAADSRDNSSCTSGAKNSSVLKSHGAENKPNTPVVANLVDLEIELTNLQQGISQIERLTPSDPFNSNDPFGDSFISYTPKPILPPPPGRERTCRVADTAGNTSSKAQAMTVGKGPPQMLSSLLQTSDELTPIKSHNESNDETIAGDWFISSVSGGPGTIKDPLTQSPLQKDLSSTLQSETPKKQDNISKQFDVFTELDPLGTGKIKPYIHKRDFFQDLKKPKKVLNDLVNDKQSYSSNTSSCPTNINEKIKSESLGFAADPFGEDPFVKSDSYSFGKDNFNVDFAILEKEQEASGFVDDMSCLTFPDLNEDSFVTTLGLESNLENDIKPQSELDSEDYRKVSPNSDNVPKPPPRPINNSLTQPPPLPPKKQPGDLCMKPPPRPPHSDDSHYDIIPKESEKDLTFSENRPPLPAPARKAKPAQFSFQQQKKKISIESSEDDYLTPIAFPPPKEFSFAEKKCFLHKSSTDDVSTNTSFQNLETPDRERWSILRNSSNMSLTDINFMLSQLTLSGLNELATELNIPLVELSNMTLAQITNYLSGIIKSRSSQNDYDSKQQDDSDTSKTNFDFADFSNFNANETTHDKYAVFRELEATEFIKVNEDDSNTSPAGKNKSVAFFSQDSTEDKYAALREITTDVGNKKLESESEKLNDEANDLIFEESLECLSEKLDETRKESGKKLDVSQSIENQEKQKLIVSHSHNHNQKTISQSSSDDKRESPKQFERSIDDVFEEEKQLQTFDSISEGASGTSPENEAAPEGIRVNRSDKEWTVFDQTKPQVGEKLSLQSEEGVSPWSSDSKEFGNSSPPEWKQTVDSGSERWGKRASQSLKDEEKWWDTSAEPDEYYEPNRRSIDSFEDEYCTYSKTLPGTKNKKKQITGASPGSQAAGGHSSSSRDISPWEEETYTLTPSQRKNVRSSENWERHSRQYFEKCRDSWDEEDDYEYDEEQYGRYYWPDRHGSRPLEKVGYSRRMKEHWANERHLWKQELERKRHCCEDWELGNAGKNNRYYGVNKRSNEGVCSHKWTGNYDDPHFLRDSQDSSWEEDYRQNSPEMQSSHYINLKHRWKRPSSASEVEKNTDEIRNKQVQYYVGITGGSDGEKERRYKANRRSRSRDAHCCEVNAHYKQDPNFTLRNHHKSRMHPQHNAPFNGNNQEMMYSNKSDDFSNKQTSGSRKKVRDDAKPNNFNAPPPPTSNVNVSWKFENNFIDSNESPPLPPPAHAVKYTFDYEQNNTGINKPPPLRRPTKINKPKNQNIRGISGNNSKNNRRFTYQSADQSIVVSRRTQRSPFEDDFSPPPPPPPATAAAAAAAAPSPSAISNQSEPTENDLKNEEQDYFSPEISDKKSAMTKIITNSNRLGNFSSDDGLKKSESVNIFVRENDPFDDDFFSENALDNFSDYAKSPKNNR